MKLKKNILVSLFVIFGMSLFAQNETKSANVIKQRLDSVIYVGSTSKYQYTYDTQGNNNTKTLYDWKSTLMKYEKVTIHEYSYNANKSCILDQYSVWDKTLNKWVITTKTDISYDENNQLLLSYEFDWSSSDNKWILKVKTDYVNSYAASGKLSGVIIYTNSTNGLYTQKYEYTYNTNGNLTTVISYAYISYNWVKGGKEEFVYDSNGNVITINSYLWDTSSSISSYWALETKNSELKYNNNYTIDQLLVPFYYFTNRSILPTDFKLKSMVTSQSYYDFLKKYYYSPMQVTGITDNLALKVSIYPNPTSDYLNINWSGNQPQMNVEFYDITGKQVLNQLVNNNSKLSIQGFNKGLYLIKLSDNGKMIETRKIIIE